MQHSYILSNKENETYQEKSLLKLKTNYQVRERYYERSKSPLAQASSNRRLNFVQSKENIKPQMTSKRRDVNYKYTDESTVRPYSQMINQNISPSNNRQSTFDLSKIKPISLENNRLGENNYKKNYEPNVTDDKNSRSEYRTFSKSAHRQNSKHLGFVAKVDNIQKINHQISSLLSYVKDSKSAQRDSNILQEHSNHKPRYGLISETSKSYQRRLNVLDKPKDHEPLISAFSADNEQNNQILQNKPSNKRFNYQYNGYGLLDKSQHRIEDRQNGIGTSKSPIRRDISPKNSGNRFNESKNPSISPLKTVKSQQFNQLLTPSQSQQKLSKLTTANNPDLQFYYESLKKRDQEIEIFKKKVENSLQNETPRQSYQQHHNQLNQSNPLYDQSNILNISSKYVNQYDRKNNYNDKKFSKNSQQHFQRDPFVTQQEIQVYKDINRLNNPTNNGRLSAVKRIQRLKAQVNQSGNENRQNITLNNAIKKQFVYDRKTNQSTTNNFTAMKAEILNKIQQPMTNKIQEQIKKIQNQLKDCKKEKSYLRQKYGDLLTKQKPNKVEETYQFPNPRHFQESQTFKNYSDTIQSNYDKERMFESSNKNICQHLVNLNNETEQDFHKDLRKRMISQNQRKKITENQKDASHEINIQTSKHDKPLTPHNGKRQNNFEIQLQKVQITKPQTTKLGTLIAQKIEIDLKLREQRQKFSRNKNPNKWDSLKSYLTSHYGINRSSKQLQQLLSISPQEHNPFSPTHMSSKSMQNFGQKMDLSNDQLDQQQIPLLCSLLSESLTYFQCCLLHKFSEKKLKKQHFSFRELDLSSKGHLSLEDLICFVNLHAGKFYRNRDIIFLLKSIMLFYNDMRDFQSKNLSKNSNQYKFSYDFLWTILTDST